MTKWNIDRGKKITGGRVMSHRKKRRFQRGSSPTLVELGEEKKRRARGRSNIMKIRLVKSQYINIADTKAKKFKKVKILDVASNPDNPNLTRRRIITKGCAVKTEAGLVKVTSRPSQHGVLNGVMIEEKSK